MHATGLSKHKLLFHLNPIKGSFATYKSNHHYPQQPNEIVYLDDLISVDIEERWHFFQKDRHFYLKV